MTAAPTTRELLAATYSPAVPAVGVEEEFMLVWPDGNAASIAPELLAVGTPPFGAPGEAVTSACHITVGLPDADLRPPVLERLRPWFAGAARAHGQQSALARAGHRMVQPSVRPPAATDGRRAGHGMAALVVSPGRAGLAPAGEVLDELMTAVEPALERSGDTCHLSDLLADRLGRGSGAQRQRALWRLGRPETFVQALANLCAGVDPHL
jgi:hypothetical protein